MGRYVAITESEMSDFMSALGFTELSVEQRGSFGRRPVKERVYETPVGDGKIRVYSSVTGAVSRDRGKDAIRVQYWVGDQKVYGAKRVHRTQNWRKNLLQRTEEIRQSVESGPLSRIPKDSRGDLMTARRGRLAHERFWGSVNYPDIRESRRFEAVSVLPKGLNTDKITDRVMAIQYMMDDSEKQQKLLKLQTALKMGLITEDEILESLDRAMSKNAESNVKRKAQKEEIILEHLNNNRQTSKYDGKIENTEGGVAQLLGITRSGVSKTLRDMEAKGLIYNRNLHVPGGRKKVQCWFVVGSGTDRGFGAEALVRYDGKWKGIGWTPEEEASLSQEEKAVIAEQMYEDWQSGLIQGTDVDEYYERLNKAAETIYVRQMGDADQQRIENELRSALRTEFSEMPDEEIESLIELGMDSKLSDLSNVLILEDYEAEASDSYDNSAHQDEMAQEAYEEYIEELDTYGHDGPVMSFQEWYNKTMAIYDTPEYEEYLEQQYLQMQEDGEEIARQLETLEAESFKPPASAVAAAKRGLAQRKKWGRGGLSPAEAKSQGIDSGVTRARKIASGKVSKHDVRRMSAFNRHRKNNRPEKKMPDGGPTAGTIAWNLWGGTSGVNWAKKKSASMNAESETDFKGHNVCVECGSDEIPLSSTDGGEQGLMDYYFNCSECNFGWFVAVRDETNADEPNTVGVSYEVETFEVEEHEERCLEILARRVYELEWVSGYANNGETEIISGSELQPPLWNNLNFCRIAELKPYETYTYSDPAQTVKITRMGEGVPRVWDTGKTYGAETFEAITTEDFEEKLISLDGEIVNVSVSGLTYDNGTNRSGLFPQMNLNGKLQVYTYPKEGIIQFTVGNVDKDDTYVIFTSKDVFRIIDHHNLMGGKNPVIHIRIDYPSMLAAEDEKCDLDYHLRCHECRLCLDCNPDADAAGNICRFCTGEEKLSKTSCCCGATESNPCVCMKAPEPMSCSAIEPKCACYKALEKNAESEDYGVEPRWM